VQVDVVAGEEGGKANTAAVQRLLSSIEA